MDYRDDLTAALLRAQELEQHADELTRQVAELRGDYTRQAKAEQAPYVFVATTGHVAALDPQTGDIAWQQRIKGSVTPLHLVADGASLFVGGSGRVFRLAPLTGDVLWSNELRGYGHDLPTLALAPRTHVMADWLFVGLATSVVALAASDGSMRWSTKLDTSLMRHFTNLALLGETLVATAKGEMWSLDPRNGDVRWHNELKGFGSGLAGIAPGSLSQFALAGRHAIDQQTATAMAAT